MKFISKNKFFNRYLPMFLSVVLIVTAVFFYEVFSNTQIARAGFNNMRTITVNAGKVPSTQDYFPMLVYGTYPYLATVPNGGKVQNSNGYDVGFYSNNDCATGKLSWNTELYTAGTGAVAYWVITRNLSVGSVIYMCYGNSSITTDQSDPGAWNTTQSGPIYHMDDNAASTTVVDTSTSADTGTNNVNTNTKSVAGQIGTALSYNGTTNVTTLAQNIYLPVYTNYEYTIAFWVNGNGATQSGKDVFAETHTSTSDSFFGISTNIAANSKLVVYLRDESNTVLLNNVVSTSNVFDGTWHYVVWTDDGNGNAKLYVDGNPDATNFSYTDTFNSILTNDSLGAAFRGGSGLNFFAGSIDEVQFAAFNPISADRVKTLYNNQSNPSTFYTIGSEALPSRGNYMQIGGKYRQVGGKVLIKP